MHVTTRKDGFFTGRRMPEMGDRMRDVRPTRTCAGGLWSSFACVARHAAKRIAAPRDESLRGLPHSKSRRAHGTCLLRAAIRSNLSL